MPGLAVNQGIMGPSDAAVQHDQDEVKGMGIKAEATIGQSVTSCSKTSSRGILKPLLDSKLKVSTFVLLYVGLLGALLYCTSWWFSIIPYVSGRVVTTGYVIASFFVLWSAFTELLHWALLFRAKVVDPAIKAPRMRVAMIATKVPSEPLSMLKKTLSAMLNQDYSYPYDVWLADEQPDAETKAWCAENGVRISCRHGIAEYHHLQWPRRSRCKEGNLAYFYDNWGYANYDVVAQFDADHVPQPNYLTTVLPSFLDPQVGYVACPSICDANATSSWAARGRLYDESYFHGPWGASMSKDIMPCCIGSHYVVRTAHLQASGGIGPELDEDMSTSYIMTANGYKGVFAINTIAHGDGPMTFEDAMRQEYQWARSAMIILVVYLGRWWCHPFRLTIAERVRTILWMSVWLERSFLSVFGPAFVVVAAFSGVGLSTDWLSPITHAAPLVVVLYLNWLACRQFGWLRPTPPLVHWEATLHRLVRNYWILIGTVHGLLGGLLGLQFDIKVTPKSAKGERMLAASNLAPLLVVAALGFLAAIPAGGLFSMGFYMGSMHLLVAVAVVALHYRENHTWASLPVRNLASLLFPCLVLAGTAIYIAGFKVLLVSRQ